MNTHKDQLHRTIFLKETPKRIISLVPSQTELLHNLGLEKFIVGITKFCVHPNHYKKEIKIVGGTKQVHYNKIKELQPDIILCNKEENTKEMVIELEKIAPVHVSDIFTIKDALTLFFQYGKLFDVTEKAQQLKVQLKKEQLIFNTFIKNKPTKKVAYFIWKKPWMVTGNNTIINYLLKINRFENCFNNKNRYPEIQLKELKGKNLDYVFLSSEPYPFTEKHIAEIQEYAPSSKIILVNGEYFSWYGSRLIGSFQYFKTLQQNL